MACAGRGRGRGLLQSVMTEGNKQLQLGHSGSCCGAPFPLSLSLCWCCCCMHFGAETNDGPEASNGCRKPTKQTMNDNNRRRRRCLQLLPELLPCCCAWQGVVYFFFLGCLCGQNIDTQVPTGPCPLLLLLFLSLLFIGAAPAEA